LFWSLNHHLLLYGTQLFKLVIIKNAVFDTIRGDFEAGTNFPADNFGHQFLRVFMLFGEYFTGLCKSRFVLPQNIDQSRAQIRVGQQ
jgi:hypothetical protein